MARQVRAPGMPRANLGTWTDEPVRTMGSNKLFSSGPDSGIQLLLFAYNLHMSTQLASSLLGNFHGKIILLLSCKWAFHDLFHPLFLLMSPYNRPRRYLCQKWIRTKGAWMSRDSTNDHPITWGKGVLILCLNFCHLSVGQTSHGDGKVQCNSTTEQFKKQIWFSYNQ